MIFPSAHRILARSKFWSEMLKASALSGMRLITIAQPLGRYANKRMFSMSRTGQSIKYVAGSETLESWTQHARLREWLANQVALCKPDAVHLCTGSAEEDAALKQQAVLSGSMVKLNEENWPGCYLARSPPADVARVESRTFICSEKQVDAGPTNNWAEPAEMKAKLTKLFDGCMKGRVMYAVPYCMGPLNSPLSAVGVQLTDSPYAVVNAKIMTRMGRGAMQMLGRDGFFVPCMHSVGAPLAPGQADDTWPQNSDKYITHFPETREIWSYGSGYGGNALTFKKAYALRIASVLARDEGWLAEHMLIMGITNPAGEKRYIAAALPSACGKTNLAMLRPSLPGWKVETVGDDIAWMRWGADGRLRAINPEAGFFGVAPGTSDKTNPNALASTKKNAIFTNVAVDLQGNPWWEGLSKQAPNELISWLRRPWTPESGEDAAHANARFTAPAANCPAIDPAWQDPAGVPISAIIFGGRRSDTMPLVYQSLDWDHGVYMGATLQSEQTAAAEGKRGALRSDPFAMKPFIGYNAGDYFKHWLSMNEKGSHPHAPKIFMVNWFRKNENGKFVWPGFGDNVRVLEWVLDRCKGAASTMPTKETPVGFVPDIARGGLNASGLGISPAQLDDLVKIDPKVWSGELKRNQETLAAIGERLPKELLGVHARVAERVAAAKKA